MESGGQLCGTINIVYVRRQMVKARDGRRITAAETKYMRITAGDTLDRLQDKYTNYTIHWPSQFCYMAAKLGLLQQGTAEE